MTSSSPRRSTGRPRSSAAATIAMPRPRTSSSTAGHTPATASRPPAAAGGGGGGGGGSVIGPGAPGRGGGIRRRAGRARRLGRGRGGRGGPGAVAQRRFELLDAREQRPRGGIDVGRRRLHQREFELRARVG